MKKIRRIISISAAAVIIAGVSVLGGIEAQAKTQSGIVSWYSQKRADGAAHRTIAFGTKVKVKNNSNGKTTTVVINDRGPYVKGRILDMSKTAFSKVAKTSAGLFNGTITW